MIEIFNGIIDFFKNVGTFVGVDYLTIITLALLALVIFISIIISNFAVEVRTNRKVKQINNYLLDNPFITDENIVEFNRIMKTKMPRAMRFQWQRYMVNRNDKPSNFLSEDNCVSKPFRTSAYVQCLKFVKYFVAVLVALSFMFTLGAVYETIDNLPSTLLRCSVVPVTVATIGVVFIMLLQARRNAVLSDLYYNFDSMQYSLDRAVSTFPAFVDYEILFTRKEISDGIPALQEYLQQRAQYEQEQLEKARLSEVDHEKYDFSKLGVKGTTIMERAMRGCEFYLGNKKKLEEDIASLQNQKELLTKNYDESNRNNQRKLRDIKETLDRLREKLNTTTNKIVGNDIIKQQADEVKKQQLIEKDMAEESHNYEIEAGKLDAQIEKKRAEMEENKKQVERDLINDFKDYSDKIYDELKNIADTQVADELSQLRDEKFNLERDLEERNQYIAERNIAGGDAQVQSLLQQLEQKEVDLQVKNQEVIGANREVESRNAEIRQLQHEIDELKKQNYHEVYRYFDSHGKEFFYDNSGNAYYLDQTGKVVYYKDVKAEEPAMPQQENVVSEPVANEPSVKEPVEQPVLDETPATDEALSLEELDILNKQIEEETKVLEETHKDLQKQIDDAEKVIEETKTEEVKEEPVASEKPATVQDLDFGDFFKGFEEVSKPEKVEEPAQEEEQKAEEKQPEEEQPKPVREIKPREKKQPKKNVETLTKITELEKKEVTRPAKKRPAKKGPAFVVKKAPKVQSSKNGGFDLSAFDEASKGGKKGKK